MIAISIVLMLFQALQSYGTPLRKNGWTLCEVAQFRVSFTTFTRGQISCRDADNLLFSYFGLVLRSVQESLVDAQQQTVSFATEQALVYDPMKQLRGERWEKDANPKARRHFRDLLIALQTVLDSLSDVIAIFFPGRIQGLKVGRSQFSRIETWVGSPFSATGLIMAPSDYYLKKLHDALTPVIVVPPPETDWLPMMRLLRNKASHLGQPLFRQVGLPNKEGRLFAFIPREWPYLWEKHIKPAGATAIPLSKMFGEGFMHQDIVTYSQGLLAKVNTLVASVSEILNEAYDQFKDLPENQSALVELEKNSEKCRFENFVGG
jgi:hypothetical protein